MSEAPQMNGTAEGQRYIDSIDPEDPEYIRQMRRPVDVKEDMRLISDRSRVSLILQSQMFRHELEQMVFEQVEKGPQSANMLALKQISDLILPMARLSHTNLFTKGTIIPIADLKGVDQMTYTKGERMLRCKTASLYRLIDLHGWSQGMKSYITVRISQNFEHFLTIPHGMMYHEVSAASLLKVDMQGEVVDAGSTSLTINKDGYSVHSAIHAARPDIKCIIHLRNPVAVAITGMDTGLLPLCQEACAIGNVSSFDYTGNLEDQEEKDKVARALGPSNKVLFLKHYGILVGGETIEEAFFLANNMMIACETQLTAVPVGIEHLRMPTEEAQRKAAELANRVPPSEEGRRKWRRGEMEFEALMRHLDNAGYRTGHIFREKIHQVDPRKDRTNSEVEVPPASSSLAYMMDEEERAKFSSPLKQHMERQKKAFKSEWLNTPNSYKKEEIDEIGTPTPKKITRWVSEDGTAQPGQSVKIEQPNQFAPQGENPKELKLKYQEIRKEYYEGDISAGPQSRVLEGMTWEEAQRIKDGHISGTSDGVIVVGAASKGIIQKPHQHNATVYKTYYAPNPFDSMNEKEIEAYKKSIGQQPGEPEGAEIQPGPDGRLISTEERMEQVRAVHVEVAPPQAVRLSSGEPTETDVDAPLSPEGKASPPVVAVEKQQPHAVQMQQPVMVKSATLPPQSQAPSSPEAEPQMQRSHSARLKQSPESVEDPPPGSFKRSKSEGRPKKSKKKSKEKSLNGDEGAAPAQSPTKSTTSSGDGTLDERSSREGSPAKEAPAELESPSKAEKKKKKKKFRMPSFSKKKEGKEPKTSQV